MPHRKDTNIVCNYLLHHCKLCFILNGINTTKPIQICYIVYSHTPTDLLAESYELSVILQHGTTYELIDFLARLQVTATSRMVQEHTEQQMVEQALVNKLESDDEPKLQKIGRRHVTKKCRPCINLLELTMVLVEVYRELEKETCAAKDMGVSSK